MTTRNVTVEIYTKSTCGFCHAAKRLLAKHDVPYTEIDILEAPERRAEMIQRSKGRQTVPQIFIADQHIGGYDDLAALEWEDKLDDLLS